MSIGTPNGLHSTRDIHVARLTVETREWLRVGEEPLDCREPA
jgi:hypothetical protein